MIKRTFAEVKTELARVAGPTGMQVTAPRLMELASIAQERLCVLGEWPYQYARLKFRQYGGIVSLPCEYEALVHTTLDREPVEVQPAWFEFLEFGPGPMDRAQWSNLGADLGESPVYRQPGEPGATLKVAATNGSDSGMVKVFGCDTKGVRQQVDFALPHAVSPVEWSKITQVIKPATAGDVVLSLTDAFGTQYVAAAYRGRDTSPTFRTYRFPIAEDASRVVHAIARRRLYPVQAETDELFITNLAALRLGVKAVAFEDAGRLADSEAAFTLAAGILAAEARLYRAQRHAPPVNVTRIGALSARPDIY